MGELKMAEKKKKTESKTIHYKLAAKVADRIAIENVKLIHAEAYQSPTAAGGTHSLNINVNVNFHINKKDKTLSIFPAFSLVGNLKEGKSQEPDLIIKAEFVLIYKVSDFTGLNQECFEAFGKSNGIYNAWPYWREFVQNTIARMTLPPLTIPVFRIIAPEKRKQRKTILDHNRR